MIQRLVRFAVLISVLTGCAANGPLPDPATEDSVVDYSNSLVSSTTAKTLDRLIDTVKDGSTDGYRWLEGWWCPRHPAVGNTADVQNKMSEYCAAHGGVYEIRGFCRDSTDTDDVLFLARVSNSSQCSGGPTASLLTIEPTGEIDNSEYIALLRKYGYESATERNDRKAELRKKQDSDLTVALQQMEMRAEELDARRLAAQEIPIGTRICRFGRFQFTLAGVSISAERQADGWLVGQLDGFSPGSEKLRFRVLRHEIPERDSSSIPIAGYPVMDEFSAVPGTVYWDDPGNWESCE